MAPDEKIQELIGRILSTIHIAVINRHDAFGVDYKKFLPYVDDRRCDFMVGYIFWVITHEYGIYSTPPDELKIIIREYLERS